jgi:flagellar assembly factor FliW
MIFVKGVIKMVITTERKQMPKRLSQQQEPIFFKWGLPGLDGYRKFALHAIEGNPFFYYLESLEDEKVGLILTDPFVCFPGYSVQLGPSEKSDLKLQEKKDVFILATVTVREKKQMTVNLAAPLIINVREKIAKQVIVSDNIEQLRVPLPAGGERQG